MPKSLADLKMPTKKEIINRVKAKKVTPEMRKKRIRAMLAKKTLLGNKKTLKKIADQDDTMRAISDAKIVKRPKRKKEIGPRGGKTGKASVVPHSKLFPKTKEY